MKTYRLGNDTGLGLTQIFHHGGVEYITIGKSTCCKLEDWNELLNKKLTHYKGEDVSLLSTVTIDDIIQSQSAWEITTLPAIE